MQDSGWEPPADYVWHHSEDLGVMELVPREVNGSFVHDGGREIVEELIAKGLYP